MGSACRGARSCSESSGKALQCCEWWHLLTLRGPQALSSHSPVCWWWPCHPGDRWHLLQQQAGRDSRVLRGWWDASSLPSSGSRGILAVEGCASGPPVRLSHPSTEPDAPSAACRSTPRTMQPPQPWLLAAGEPKSQVQGYMNFFFFLKNITKCQEGLCPGALCSWGSSFAPLSWGGGMSPATRDPSGAKLGSVGMSLAPVPRPSAQTIQRERGAETLHNT